MWRNDCFSSILFLCLHILINLNKEAFIWHLMSYTSRVFEDSSCGWATWLQASDLLWQTCSTPLSLCWTAHHNHHHGYSLTLTSSEITTRWESEMTKGPWIWEDLRMVHILSLQLHNTHRRWEKFTNSFKYASFHYGWVQSLSTLLALALEESTKPTSNSQELLSYLCAMTVPGKGRWTGICLLQNLPLLWSASVIWERERPI